VLAFALEGEFEVTSLASNTFSMEWPPRSGRVQQFPEADRAAWLSVQEARSKLLKGQIPMLEALIQALQ
jgi:predicted NUDIX family NTP pyrophosphohydrolase